MSDFTLKAPVGANKAKKIVGRGSGSGLGTTAGRGNKGQQSRSGGGTYVGFEGGQMPLQRRLPKRGFKNYPFKITYSVISLGRLVEAFPEITEISLEAIYGRKLAVNGSPVKILGDGDVSAALQVEAHKFSASARQKIENAGGKANALEA